MKILIYPTFDNPYQKLLYDEIKKDKSIKITYFDDGYFKSHYLISLIFFPIRLIYYRFNGYSIFHLHWQHFEVPFFNEYIRYILSSVYAVVILLIIKILGYKLVWTVHNIIPHNRKFIDDLWITKFILFCANVVIVHSYDTKKRIVDFGYNKKNIVVIPQGNFIDTYPNTINKKEAQKLLNIPQNKFVMLFFGLIREYKGIEELVSIFNKIDTKDIVLLVVGNVLDKSYKKNLIKKFNKYESIIHKLEFIPDDELQYYFNTSDIVIFPFKKNTNSSSIILSFSFGKTVIAPYMGGIKDLPAETGFFYEKKYQIVQILNQIKQDVGLLNKKNKYAYEYVKPLTWEKSARVTIKLYKDLLNFKNI